MRLNKNIKKGWKIKAEDIKTSDKNKIYAAGFIAQQIGFPKLNCHIEEIDKLNLTQLDQSYIASQFDGSNPTQENKDHALIPLQAIFRVRLNNCVAGDEKKSLLQELAGTVSLSGERESFVGKGFRKVVAVWNGEAGFW